MSSNLNSQGGGWLQRDEASEQDPSLFVTQANNFDPNPSGDFDWENMLEGQNSMWAADGN